MQSMTGYGRSTVEADGNSVTVEVNSVNSRKQIDLRITLPRELSFLDYEFRQLAQKALSRGTFQINVSYKLSADVQSQAALIDTALAVSVARQLREVGLQAQLREPTWTEVLQFPGVITASDRSPYESLRSLALKAFENALADLTATRRAEGLNLKKDLLARGETIRLLVEHIDSREQEAIDLLKQKLQERIASLGLELPIDDEKLSREVIFYVEKADITEEVVRLKSHLVKYAELLNSDGDPGRDLDFLGQEMNREANTLSSKTADMSIAEDALKLKTELSRIREQIMNIE